MSNPMNHHEVLQKHGWLGDAESGSYEHSSHPNDTIEVDHDGDWNHLRQGTNSSRSVGGGDDHQSLDAHLNKFHKVKKSPIVEQIVENFKTRQARKGHRK